MVVARSELETFMVDAARFKTPTNSSRRTIVTGFASIVAFTCVAIGMTAEPETTSGIERKNFDTGVRAQDDLFRHVNGKWLDEAAIPSDRPAYGTIFELRDKAEKSARAIIEEAAKNPSD